MPTSFGCCEDVHARNFSSPLVKVENVPLDLYLAKPNDLLPGIVYAPDAFYLRKEAAEAYQKAAEWFQKKGYELVGVDAYRPRSFQAVLLGKTPEDGVFIKGVDDSNHPKGLAVAVKLRKDGVDVVTQTAIGVLTADSHADREEGLSEQVLGDRIVLQYGMTKAGFARYHPLWWHFDFPGNARSLDVRPAGIPSLT